MIKFLIVCLMSVVGATAMAAPKVFTASKDRTVFLVGEVGVNAFLLAAQIQELATESNDPIDIVINSPGGSVEAGLQLISSMNMAKSRGIKFRCVVPVMAASMGFQVLANCNERYALSYALLLWHPMKIFIMMGTLSADDLLYAGYRIRSTETPLVAQLIRELKITPDLFYYHYRHETVWFGYEFRSFSPNFLTVVDDIKNVGNPFKIK